MSVGGGPMDGPALPPIFMGAKKGGKNAKGVGHSQSTVSGNSSFGAGPPTLGAFNSTKKNFPQLNKLKKN